MTVALHVALVCRDTKLLSLGLSDCITGELMAAAAASRRSRAPIGRLRV